jgi:hypothetical protein
MDVIDRHRARGIGQQLGLSHGWSNGNRVAAMVRSVALFLADTSKTKVSTPQTLAILEQCGDSVRAIMKLGQLANGKFNSRMMGAAVVYHSVHPQKASAFVESFMTGIGWTAGCPQKAMDKWASQHKLETTDAPAAKAAAAALHYYHRGEPVQILRVSEPSCKWLRDLNPKLRDFVVAEIKGR